VVPRDAPLTAKTCAAAKAFFGAGAGGIGMAGITRRRRYAARSSPAKVEPS